MQKGKIMNQRKIALVIASILLGGNANAQPSRLSPYFHDRPHGEILFLKFCAFGFVKSKICTERRAIAYGQVCNPWLARSMGTGASGNVEKGIPGWPMRYAGWRCETNTPPSLLAHGTEGDADPPLQPGEPYYRGDVGGMCKNIDDKRCAVLINDTGITMARCAYHHADGFCPSWKYTQEGYWDMKRRTNDRPKCPNNLSIEQLIASGQSCNIPGNEIQIKNIGGFAN